MILRNFTYPAVILLVLAGFLPPGATGQAKGKTLLEQWGQIHAKEGKLGYQHFHAQEIEQDGLRLIRTVYYEETTILAGGKPFKEKTWYETLETETGKVVEIAYRLHLSKEQVLKVRGTIAGSELTLRVLGDDGKPTRFTQKVPWNKDVLGLYAQETFFRGKKLKAKDAFEIKSFDFTLHRVLPTTWTVQRTEQVELAKGKKNLLRIKESHPRVFYLPDSILWVDEAGTIVKNQVENVDLGPITTEITSRERARADFQPKVKEKEGSIPIDKPLKVGPGKPAELVLRVEVEGEEDPGTLFREDGRQKILKADKKVGVVLKLLARAPLTKPDKIVPAAAEYLDSNLYVRSDHPLVVKLARQAAGKAETPSARVKAIGRWINENLKVTYEINHATADEVARILEGDCTEFSVLGAAMCRALGIPARIAVGLVYNPENPGFDYHQWVEVYLDGQWQTFDPTGAIDSVQAAFIKIADYSLNGVINPDGLSELHRATSGRVKITVLESK